MYTFTSHSADETIAIANDIAQRLYPGDVVALFGDLGAGKTIFARGLAHSLGVNAPVSSPTYTIQHTYKGQSYTVHHLDLYRLETVDDIDMLDLDSCWESDAITIIEWPERAGNLLPPQTWHVNISIEDSLEQRDIEIRPPLDRIHHQ